MFSSWLFGLQTNMRTWMSLTLTGCLMMLLVVKQGQCGPIITDSTLDQLREIFENYPVDYEYQLPNGKTSPEKRERACLINAGLSQGCDLSDFLQAKQQASKFSSFAVNCPNPFAKWKRRRLIWRRKETTKGAYRGRIPRKGRRCRAPPRRGPSVGGIDVNTARTDGSASLSGSPTCGPRPTCKQTGRRKDATDSADSSSTMIDEERPTSRPATF
uniref:Uncharacterized protein n=1 Tax=Plectus sambesii TaxID=2011161 RepID=A0A914W5F9_9BILA